MDELVSMLFCDLSIPSLVPRPMTGERVGSSLSPSPPQQSSLAVRITLLYIIRTASDNSCGGGLGKRLGGVFCDLSIPSLVPRPITGERVGSGYETSSSRYS